MDDTNPKRGRGRPAGSLAKCPRNPKRVIRILRMAAEKKGIRAIGREEGISHQAVAEILARWGKFYKEQPK